MPERLLVAKELAEFVSILGHPIRIRIVEDLRNGEKDVSSISQSLDIPHSEASRHLSILRTHKIVAERRDGRHVFYHLENQELAEWLATGLIFIDRASGEAERFHTAIEKVKKLWSSKTSRGSRSAGRRKQP